MLINTSLSRQFGASEGVQPNQAQVSAALAASEQNIASLPAEQRQVFRDTVREYAEGQLMLIEIGRRALTEAGKKNVTEQQAISEGTKLRNAWADKSADVIGRPAFRGLREESSPTPTWSPALNR